MKDEQKVKDAEKASLGEKDPKDKHDALTAKERAELGISPKVDSKDAQEEESFDVPDKATPDKDEQETPDKGEQEAPDKDMEDDASPDPFLADLGAPDKDDGADDEESKQQREEETKAAANQRLKDHRMFEFMRTTKYSEYYQRLIPNKHFRGFRADDARIYGGRFTQKGNLYYCSSQESISLYDTRDPYNWTLRSKIDAQHIQWTVTDMDVTPDEQFMVYSSIDPYVRLVDLDTMRRK